MRLSAKRSPSTTCCWCQPSPRSCPRTPSSPPAFPQHRPEPAAGVRRDGHGDRSAPGHCHRAGGRHRHRAQEPDAERAGARRWRKVKRYEIRRAARPGRHHARSHRAPGAWRCREQLGVSGFPVCEAARWSASSPAATCASRPATTRRCSEIMTPRERLVTVPDGTTPEAGQGLAEQAQARARAGGQRRFRAQGPDHREGHHQADQLPQRRTRRRRARCAWAPPSAWARAPKSAWKLLVEAGVDAIVVDTAHGHSKGVIERVRWVKQNYPQVDVVGGNIATGAAALALAEAGADARQGRHRPGLASAPRASWPVWACRRSRPSTTCATALEGTGVPLIADGGIRYSRRHCQGHRRRRRHA